MDGIKEERSGQVRPGKGLANQMWSPNHKTLKGIESRLSKMNLPGGVQNSMTVIDRVLKVQSLEDLKRLIDENTFLCSEEVIEIMSDLRSKAEDADDPYSVNNLSITITTLSFLYENRLRSQVVVPHSLRMQVQLWRSKTEKGVSDMTPIERDEAITLSRAIVEARGFDQASSILRRDILRWIGEALLEAYSSTTHDPKDLNDSARFLSEATELCPSTSIDFARCTTYGGVALLLKSEMPDSATDLDTAIVVLQYAVAACAYNPHELLDQAGTALAQALLKRFMLRAQVEDLQKSADIIIYTIGEISKKSKTLAPDTGAVASAIWAQLQSRSTESERRQALVDVLDDALQR